MPRAFKGCMDVQQVSHLPRHGPAASGDGVLSWAQVTRKGATSAKDGQLGIIPGSMGVRRCVLTQNGWRGPLHQGCLRSVSRVNALADLERMSSHRCLATSIDSIHFFRWGRTSPGGAATARPGLAAPTAPGVKCRAPRPSAPSRRCRSPPSINMIFDPAGARLVCAGRCAARPFKCAELAEHSDQQHNPAGAGLTQTKLYRRAAFASDSGAACKST